MEGEKRGEMERRREREGTDVKMDGERGGVKEDGTGAVGGKRENGI